MNWEQVWGPTDLVAIDCETGAVFGRPATAAKLTDDVYQWSGDPRVWTPLKFPAKPVKAIVAAGWKSKVQAV